MAIFIKMIHNCNWYLRKSRFVCMFVVFGPNYIFVFRRKPYHLQADFSNLNFHSNAHRSLQTFFMNVVRPFNLLNFSLPYTKSKKLISITLTHKNSQTRSMKKVCKATFVVCKYVYFFSKRKHIWLKLPLKFLFTTLCAVDNFCENV